MNLIELHILQSFPVTCLNRDDLGAPKSARFGGVERARVSSQCWKRAIREFAHDANPEIFAGVRTKILGPSILKVLKELGVEDERLANAIKEIILHALKKDDKKDDMVKTLLFISPETLKNIIKPLVVNDDLKIKDDEVEAILSTSKKDADKAKKAIDKRLKAILKGLGEKVDDAADIALFGRMVADDANQTVEGAALFSHALSTHAVRSELDFFTAVDDEKENKNEDDAGAAQLGTIEYNSACYYRYVGINLDLLKQSNFFNPDQLKTILEIFIRASILANPNARKNSMFGQSLPSYVLAVKRTGQPLSLANAFEKAVSATKNGFVDPSIRALKREWADIKTTFGLQALVECELEKGNPETKPLDKALEELLNDIE
jgi:CRISPR system Cascade subunit CasC